MDRIKISRSGDNFTEALLEALGQWPVVSRIVNGSSGHRIPIFAVGRSGGQYWAFFHTSNESEVCWGSTPDEAVERMYHQSQKAKDYWNRFTSLDGIRSCGHFGKLKDIWAIERIQDLEPGLLASCK